MSDYNLQKIDDYRWMIPRSGEMRVPGIIYSSRELMKELKNDESPAQVSNVAHLPGIVKYSLAMPDMHWGYGFPIGGVAAFDLNEGVISPGGVGYDINCGCRMITTKLHYDEVKNVISDLTHCLFRDIPSGVGSTGQLKLRQSEVKEVLKGGAVWAVKNGYGSQSDLETTEEGGRLESADPGCVSDRA
ncbi:MAG: RtcB family protein, partial [Syntrophaceae bacterium]